MSLPAQLQKQIDDAKALAPQLFGGEPAPEEKEPEGEPAPDEAAQEPAKNDPTGTPPVQPAAKPAEDDENSPTYAQRWRSLQGVYNTTKHALDSAQQRIANLEQLVAQMQTAAPASAPNRKTSHLTEQDKTSFGEDMIDFARRAARDEAAPLAQVLQEVLSRLDQVQNVVPMVQQVAHTQAQNTHERFYDALTQRVPDWRTVNEDKRFHAWLLETDPLSGFQRQTLLTDAHNALDLPRTAVLFDTFKREAGITSAPAAAAATPAPNTAQSKLEKMVAPGRASAATQPPSPTEKKEWSRPEIAKFYADKLAGRYKGREAEAQTLERDIFLAQREGRVAHSAA
jgi:hypothetical protein